MRILRIRIPNTGERECSILWRRPFSAQAMSSKKISFFMKRINHKVNKINLKLKKYLILEKIIK
jgi:hypothetical protein